jgi:hypothetical protein
MSSERSVEHAVLEDLDIMSLSFSIHAKRRRPEMDAADDRPW